MQQEHPARGFAYRTNVSSVCLMECVVQNANKDKFHRDEDKRNETAAAPLS